MNRKIVIALIVPMIVGIIFLGLVTASSSTQGIRAETKITRHVFRGVGDEEIPWLYIYIRNPTWHTIDIESVQLDCYVDGVFHPELSGHPTPDWKPERWDTEVLPFEKSVILYFNYIVGEGEPEGVYSYDITVYAVVMGEDIELKTGFTYQVFL